MEECFRCGATRDETRLFDAIADEGVVKACRDCIKRESLPTIRKPSLDQLKESEDRISVREKLSMMAGVESKTDSQGNKGYVKTSSDKSKNEYNLNDIIERNLEKRKLSKRTMEKLPPEKELVENFHWRVMRARRFKKISQEQLGKEIGESETAVSMVENGELPEDFERLIKKLEAYLRVRLFKNQEKKKPSQAEVSFDPYSTKTTTVGDLKEEEEKQKSEVSDSEEELESERSEGESEDEEEYPEKNKTRRSKLWNLFRKKARKAQNKETESDEEGESENNANTIEEIDDTEGLYYDDLDDYSYQEYEKPGYDENKKEEERVLSQGQETEKSKTDQSREKRHRDFKTRKETTDKEEKKDKDKDDLSQKDIDDLIFRKS